MVSKKECFICYGSEQPNKRFLVPCLCSGSIGQVHELCLQKHFNLNPDRRHKCQTCNFEYRYELLYSDALNRILVNSAATSVAFSAMCMSVNGILYFILVPVPQSRILAPVSNLVSSTVRKMNRWAQKVVEYSLDLKQETEANRKLISQKEFGCLLNPLVEFSEFFKEKQLGINKTVEVRFQLASNDMFSVQIPP
ncbi:hypothetical protein L596_028120 [Steinernema carpocapsae]|uniref:RING-CH-type domain-containing protein n=1 Tax=Steinernema carpocapsae TaxID=34508 RepID=A0A4U5LXH9_STECR|nr:hypothetical protein L596_028120 [Steinernema carpocapsae]